MLWNSDTGELKMGVKLRALDKERADLRSRWRWRGDDLYLSQFEGAGNTITEGGYNIGRVYNREAFRSFFYSNQGPGAFEEEVRNAVNLGEPYNAEEDITSVYAMSTQDYGKLTMLVGVRAEFNDLDYTGANLVVNDDDVLSNMQENVKRSYDFVYPNLQFRYRIDPEVLNLSICLQINLDRWNALSEEARHILTDEATKYAVEANQWFRELRIREYAELAETGFQSVPAPDPEAFRDLAHQVVWERMQKRAPDSVEALKPLFYPQSDEGARAGGRPVLNDP